MRNTYSMILDHIKERLKEEQTDYYDDYFSHTPLEVECLDALDFVILKSLIKQASIDEDNNYIIYSNVETIVSKMFVSPGYCEYELVIFRIVRYQDVNSLFLKYHDESTSYVPKLEAYSLNGLKYFLDEDEEIESVSFCKLMPNFKIEFVDEEVILRITIDKRYIDNLFNLQ